ncbi:MAG: TPM domain-containing protein [Tannerellaceae bacterium]|nr:TPM domain-containing protein [Tannerellaceae bacterium]
MKKQIKHLLLLITWISCIYPTVSFAIDHTIYTIPHVRQLDGNKYVSNPDKIISTPNENEINQKLKKLEKEKTIEVAVVAVKSIGNYDAGKFATELFAYWGIGKSEDDNGLLIFLVTDPPQRSVIFETGYGLEKILTDDLCSHFQQGFMLPYMKEGEYSAGMLNGVNAVVSFLMESDYEAATIPNKVLSMLVSVLLVLLLPGIFIFAYFKKRRKRPCPGCSNKTYKYIRTVTQHATYNADGLKQMIYMCSSCGRTDTIPTLLPRLRRSRSYRSTGYRSSSSRSYRTSGNKAKSSSSSKSKSSSGRSYGGGRSGGSGARSKF